MEKLQLIFQLIIDSSLAASAVILLVLAIQILFQKYISPRMAHLLWLVVLIRLLFPVFPNSPISIFNLFLIGQDSNQLEQLSLSLAINEQFHFPIVDEHPIADHPPTFGTVPPTKRNTAPLSMISVLSVVWFIGAVILSIYFIAALCRLRKERTSYNLVTQEKILSIVNECREKFGIQKSIPIYTGGHIKSPYISGLRHPWIYMPNGLDRQLKDNQLIHVFAHELAHLKRRDTIWIVIGSFALAIHWFNPLVWFLLEKMKSDMEIACDFYTLEILGEEQAIPYGLTMVECLQQLSSQRQTFSPLHFANNLNQMKRRVHMIKSFKVGSYRLSALAIVSALIIGAATLTNAGTTSYESQTLFESDSRIYGSLEKGVKVSHFKYKVPAVLPDSYQFSQISIHRSEDETIKTASVTIPFEKRVGKTLYGNLFFSAMIGADGLEKAYKRIEQYESNDPVTQKIEKELWNDNGLEGIKVIVTRHNREKLYYIWNDQNIQYQIDGNSQLTHQEILTMINSMKYPDKDMFNRYVNDKLLNQFIYDTDDLQKVHESIGFLPKYPMNVPGGFKPTHAMDTMKLNFSHPSNDEDYWSRLLFITYENKEKDDSLKSSFILKQIKNNNIYETIKAEGAVEYSRIDGQPHLVRVSPSEIDGKEVLVTEKYKVDGPLSSPNSPNLTSYFWKENEICFQVTFSDENSDNIELIKFLMNVDYMNSNNLH